MSAVGHDTACVMCCMGSYGTRVFSSMRNDAARMMAAMSCNTAGMMRSVRHHTSGMVRTMSRDTTRMMCSMRSNSAGVMCCAGDFSAEGVTQLVNGKTTRGKMRNRMNFVMHLFVNASRGLLNVLYDR